MSDLDLVLFAADPVTDAWHEQVDQLARDVTAWTGNDARPLVYEEAEIGGRGATDPFSAISRGGRPPSGVTEAFEHLIGAR